MAYGMEVKNSSDRTIFTTEEEFCLYTYGNITNSNTNGAVASYTQSDFNAGKLLFARPQNGESGAICGTLTSSNYTFFGEGEYGNENTLGGWTHEDDFPSADGVKYTIATRLDASTPGTGYGLQVTKSNGTDLIMDSENLTKRMNILDIVGGGSGTGSVTYTKPGSVAFNEIFVVASQFQARMSWSAAAGFVPGSSMVAGTWAYFDNSAGTITLYNGYIIDFGNQIYYDASGTNNTFVGTQKVQYIIMHLPLG
jgi:hypothetical protein